MSNGARWSVRGRSAARPRARPRPADALDVNAVVSYNVKAIRERRGWTQQSVAERLGRLTGHQLPQASISAMERGFDGERRRRFDAHELYLLSVVFDVPIAYFFIPPPGTGSNVLADTGRPVTELYAALLGQERQLDPLDERLAEIQINNPEDTDPVLAAVFGGPEEGAQNWHESFRTWRKKRLRRGRARVRRSARRGRRVPEGVRRQGRGARAAGLPESMAHREGETTLEEQEIESADEATTEEILEQFRSRWEE